MYLIIDTETNGLPDCKDIPYGFYPDYKLLDRYNKARIIQISYMLCNENIEEKELHDFVIKRENFTIDNSEFHGITNEISDNGYDYDVAINNFIETLGKCEYIIAHNINFDVNVIKSELYRRNKLDLIEIIDSKKLICTVKKFKYLVKAKNKINKIKNPSLKELYQFCFNNENDNAHNSKYDVINLHKCIYYISKNYKSFYLK